MSRQPSKKPRPRPDEPGAIVTDKKSAAIGQLESAILLWFNEADPVSILVLASNAEDCFHALALQHGKQSFWKAGLKNLPPSFWERVHYVQDFAKHGVKDLTDSVRWVPYLGEGLMAAAAECCLEVYGEHAVTPIMRLFRARLFWERPRWAPKEFNDRFRSESDVRALFNSSRKQFFESCRKVMLRF